MSKVELAKMLGLRLIYNNDVTVWSLKDLLSSHWYSVDYTFNADIIATLTQEDLVKDKLDISDGDLIEPEDIKACIQQCDELLWERAAAEYLNKITNIIETLKV